MEVKYTVHTTIEYEYLRDTIEALVRPLEPKRMLPYFITPIIALIVLVRGSFVLGLILLALAAFIFFRNLTSRKRYINRVIKEIKKSGDAMKLHCKVELYDDCFSLTCKRIERTYTLAYSTITRFNEQGGYLVFGGYNKFDAILPKKDFTKIDGALEFFQKKCGQEGE